eukprot:753285-Hanusia_phi.AAC.3
MRRQVSTTHQSGCNKDGHSDLIKPGIFTLPDRSSSNPEGVGSGGNEEGGHKGEEQRHNLNGSAVRGVFLGEDCQGRGDGPKHVTLARGQGSAGESTREGGRGPEGRGGTDERACRCTAS